MMTMLGSYTTGVGGWVPFECINRTSGSAVGKKPSSVTRSDNIEASGDIVPFPPAEPDLLFIGLLVESTKREFYANPGRDDLPNPTRPRRRPRPRRSAVVQSVEGRR